MGDHDGHPGRPSAKNKALTMLKLWPSSPLDQATPRASQMDRNPFELPPPTSPQKSPVSTPTLHPLLGPPSPGRLGGGEPPTAAFNSFAAAIPTAIPTTQLSLGNEFSMKPPPTKPRLHPPPSPTSSSGQSSPVTARPPVAINGTQATSADATTGTTQNALSRGQIHVKLIQARGLSVKSAALSSPYVVVQFEQAEFVSREAIDDSEKELKGTAISRNPSSIALNALGAISNKAGMHHRSNSTTPSSSVGSTRPSLIPPPTTNGAVFGGRSANNPVWKHEVSFDVTSDRSLVTFNVYDRSAEDQPFLGTLQVKPVLVHDHTVDQWYKLRPYESEDVTGDMRVQITFEQYKTKRALTPRDFEFLKLIGRGTFGKVFQVRKRDTKRIYAMKVLSKKEIVAKKEVAHTIGERKILQTSLQCPFLVGLKFSFQTDTDLYLVTDFKSGGELFWHLQKETRFMEDRARFYIAELVLALEHLHKFDIVYRDLKPENILLDATGHVALCDFGLSKPDLRADELTTTFCGTTEYLAPEILLDEQGYSKIVDFWSLGVLLFEMCCGWSPFYAEDTQQMYKNICFGKIRFPKGVICEEGKMFVKGLLNRNPKHRLGATRDAAELKEHPFFTSIDWKALSLKQVTPPFKPVVESDESTNCFDPEFTSADISDFVYADDDELDEEDPSERWVSRSFNAHTPNGPLGSERLSSKSREGSSGSLAQRFGASLGLSSMSPQPVEMNGRTPNGSGRGSKSGASTGSAGSDDSRGTGRSQGIEIKSKKKRKDVNNGGSPLTNSVQENFRGFTYSGGESVTTGLSAMGNGRELDIDMTGSPPQMDDAEDDLNDFGKSVGRYSDRQQGGGDEDMMFES